MKIIEKLFVTNKVEWRKWLRKNHDTKKGVWLVFHKKHTGKPSVRYDDAVEEALCFGWVDSIIKKIDDEKFARKFTPRQTPSKWSELNKKRALEMMKAGKMAEAGISKIREAEKSGEWFRTTVKKELKVPPYITEALAANKKAQEFFNSLAGSYKRNYVGWITSARREDTRKKRLTEVIQLLEQGKKLGMK